MPGEWTWWSKEAVFNMLNHSYWNQRSWYVGEILQKLQFIIKSNEFVIFLDNLVLSFSEFYMMRVLSMSALYAPLLACNLNPTQISETSIIIVSHVSSNALPLDLWQIPALLSVPFHFFWMSGLMLLILPFMQGSGLSYQSIMHVIFMTTNPLF